jgi:hypothetical protein
MSSLGDAESSLGGLWPQLSAQRAVISTRYRDAPWSVHPAQGPPSSLGDAKSSLAATTLPHATRDDRRSLDSVAARGSCNPKRLLGPRQAVYHMAPFHHPVPVPRHR